MFHVKHSPPKVRELTPLAERLEMRARAGLLRTPTEGAYPTLSFCSNDYLGLAREPVRTDGPLGAGASRLVAGQVEAHRELEHAVASWLGTEDALLFSSGYAANVGALSSLLGPDDQVFSDALNHASIIDGIRLSPIRAVRFPHNDLDALERLLAESAPARGARWVVTESYFSMDADTPDLARMSALCAQHGAFLILDETHAVGLFGAEGRGLAAQAGVTPDVLIGAFGKAFGAQGGFLAGSSLLRTYLWNHARAFVFSTGLSPILTTALSARLQRVRGADAERAQVHAHARTLRTRLAQMSLPGRVLGHGPIVPLEVASERDALAIATYMHNTHIHIYPIRPPSAATSRLRLTVSAAHTEADLETLCAALSALHLQPEAT
jgi:8-amino-7-oxononanoate synthase